MTGPLSRTVLDELRNLSTSTVANAIETFELRLRNTGFADSSLHCLFPELPPVVGYAATARMRTSVPPMEGHAYVDRTDWWKNILQIPAPRVIVVEDIDKRPGLGSLIGSVHAAILQALGCVAFVTNGAVRDLSGIRGTGFQVFAGNVAVSHAYAHIFEFGTPVEVGRLRVQPRDLLHGDQHGVLEIPIQIAASIPSTANAMMQKERRIIEFCRSSEFSLENLEQLVRDRNRTIHSNDR